MVPELRSKSKCCGGWLHSIMGSRGRNERAARDEIVFADFNRSNIYGAGFWSVTRLSSIDDKCVISKDKLTQVPSRVLKEKSGPPQAQINAQ